MSYTFILGVSWYCGYMWGVTALRFAHHILGIPVFILSVLAYINTESDRASLISKFSHKGYI